MGCLSALVNILDCVQVISRQDNYTSISQVLLIRSIRQSRSFFKSWFSCLNLPSSFLNWTTSSNILLFVSTKLGTASSSCQIFLLSISKSYRFYLICRSLSSTSLSLSALSLSTSSLRALMVLPNSQFSSINRVYLSSLLTISTSTLRI